MEKKSIKSTQDLPGPDNSLKVGFGSSVGFLHVVAA